MLVNYETNRTKPKFLSFPLFFSSRRNLFDFLPHEYEVDSERWFSIVFCEMCRYVVIVRVDSKTILRCRSSCIYCRQTYK